MLQVPLPQPKIRHTQMGTPYFYFWQRLAESTDYRGFTRGSKNDSPSLYRYVCCDRCPVPKGVDTRCLNHGKSLETKSFKVFSFDCMAVFNVKNKNSFLLFAAAQILRENLFIIYFIFYYFYKKKSNICLQ